MQSVQVCKEVKNKRFLNSSSATTKSIVCPSCLVGVLYDISLEKNQLMANEPLLRNWPRKLPNSAKMQNNGYYAIQGHSRSQTLIPIESPYTTSYKWLILTYLLSCIVSKLWLIICQIFTSLQRLRYRPRPWWSGIVVSVLALINEVNQHRALLVLSWVTAFGFNSRCGTFIAVCDQPPRSTQPGHPVVGRRNEYQLRCTNKFSHRLSCTRKRLFSMLCLIIKLINICLLFCFLQFGLIVYIYSLYCLLLSLFILYCDWMNTTTTTTTTK